MGSKLSRWVLGARMVQRFQSLFMGDKRPAARIQVFGKYVELGVTGNSSLSWDNVCIVCGVVFIYALGHAFFNWRTSVGAG